MKPFIKPSHAAWLLLLLVMSFAVYGAGLGIRYYSDDFQFLYHPVSETYLHWLLHRNPYVVYAYRPVEAVVLLFVQSHFGLNTAPIHIIAIVFHVLLSWLVYLFMRRREFTPLQAMIGSVFMLVSQANAHAVMSNDTLSQVFGTFFGCCSVWLLYEATWGREELEDRRVSRSALYLMSWVAFSLSLFSKETSFGFFLMVLGVVTLRGFRNGNGGKPQIAQIMLRVLPYALIVIFYMGMRSYVGVQRPSFGGEEASFRIGSNIVENLALFGFASVVPASTARTFLAVKNRDLVALCVIGIGALIWAGCVVTGLLRSDRKKEIMAYVGLAVSGLFPALLMTHVSELYLYNSMPLLSILFGIGIGQLMGRMMKSRAWGAIVSGAFCLLLLSHVAAVQEKAALMKRNGERAEMLLKQIGPYAQLVPNKGTLILKNPETERVQYSVFLLNGFDVLEFATSRVKYISDRPDITVRILDAEEAEARELESKMEGGANVKVLTLRGDKVIFDR